MPVTYQKWIHIFKDGSVSHVNNSKELADAGYELMTKYGVDDFVACIPITYEEGEGLPRRNMPITPKPLQIKIYCKDCGTYLKARFSKVNGEISIEPCWCPLNEIRKVYEKYKHLDKVICDTRWGNDYTYVVLREFWQAIKASVETEPPADTPTEEATDTGYYAP